MDPNRLTLKTQEALHDSLHPARGGDENRACAALRRDRRGDVIVVDAERDELIVRWGSSDEPAGTERTTVAA